MQARETLGPVPVPLDVMVLSVVGLSDGVAGDLTGRFSFGQKQWKRNGGLG